MQMVIEAMAENITIIRLVGRMDVRGAQDVDLKFSGVTAVDRGIFIVDLSGVDFLASIGIRTFLVTAKAVKARGGRLALCSPTALVGGVLEMSGIKEIIPVYGDTESARIALTSP